MVTRVLNLKFREISQGKYMWPGGSGPQGNWDLIVLRLSWYQGLKVWRSLVDRAGDWPPARREQRRRLSQVTSTSLPEKAMLRLPWKTVSTPPSAQKHSCASKHGSQEMHHFPCFLSLKDMNKDPFKLITLPALGKLNFSPREWEITELLRLCKSSQERDHAELSQQ